MKNIYFYRNIDPVTTEFHSDGGLVIITGDDPQEVWDDYCSDRDAYQRPFPSTLGEPERVISVSSKEKDGIIIYPNAGCC